MKHRLLKTAIRTLVLLFASASAHAGLTDLASSPLVTSSSSSVPPNLMLLLDDSGSMDWNYLPDWAGSSPYSGQPWLFTNNTFNGVAYNPAITYNPPVYYKADGTIDTTTYPSMTAANSSDWTSVPVDGYNVQSTSTSDLVDNASFYVFVAGEYCSDVHLKNCVAQSSPSSAYPYPATLRWCTSNALTTCQAVRIDSSSAPTKYTYARYPKSATATVTLSNSSNTSVSGITVDTGAGAQQIMSVATSSSSTIDTIGSDMATNINACSAGISGNCTVAGYSASFNSSNNKLTITAPTGSGAITATPVISKSGSMTMSASAFSGGIPGSNIYTDIVAGNNSYPYPGRTTKASTRSDCVGSTCTYAEEMTNYANWYAYYQTRMQMMKTGTSLAFQNIGTNYQVGYATINNNQGDAFINPAQSQFNPTNKLAWYKKLFLAKPNNSTPLRIALASIGRLYAGQYDGSSYNGVPVTDDPMQYSCQQNFTILSTDGYWNEDATPTQIDGSTAIGNQDGMLPRPFNDSGSAIVTTITPSVTTTQTQTVQPVTTTTPWTMTTTTIGASCSTAGSTPSGCVSPWWGGTWCMADSSTPKHSSNCSSSIGAGGAYACNWSKSWQATGTPCTTDSSGQTWCVYDNKTTTGTTGCTSVSGNQVYVCKPPSVSGNTVTTTTQTYNQTQIGSTTSIDSSALTTNTTVVTTNGVPAPPTTSTSGPVVTNVSTSASYTSDTGAPTGTSTWTTTSSSTCTAPPLPSAGSTPAVAGSASTANNGAPVTTTLSTSTVVGTPTITSTSSGGTKNTLADVAAYYYNTDLRTAALGNCTGSTGLDVCTNDVPTSGSGPTADSASWQHMTTFTQALGASGFMQFSPTYPTDTIGDYFDVANGTGANPSGGVCSWQTGGACNWPVPVSNEQTTIDDLWHAAVNGHGAYFSATNPATLQQGLSNALAGVSARTGSSAAATTSNPNVTSGDNFVFSSTFTTVAWYGELVRQTLDLTTGAVLSNASSSTCPDDWCAAGQLDANAARTIYMANSTATNGLQLFNWGNLSAAQQAYFSLPYISSLSQFCVSGVTCLPDPTAAAGSPLVAFLTGDRTNEGVATDTTKYFRQRTHVLGDIVDAEPAYVRLPQFAYADAGYAAFAAAQASRQGMVYVGSNDGMLHAFYSTTGAEAWTYVPTLVLPNLYKLADKNYGNLHQFYVDGTPVASDAYFGGAWHTIVVGGMNSGGRGYYALDVTNPLSPALLWEYTDANMGYTFGNPVITKLQDGTWVVLVTSGYNNVPDANKATGDGVGRLYVLNAATGALIRTISTGVGSVTTPSGLARISAWVNNTNVDNTALQAYGGDMLGNLWRFDINGNIGAAGYDAQLLVTLCTNAPGYTSPPPTTCPALGTVPQPITAKPELGLVGTSDVVYVGTGRFLGATDLTDTTQQTFYAIKDTLGTTTYTNPQATGSNFVQQVETTTTCPTNSPSTICTIGEVVRTSTSNTVNFATDNGWYINLPDPGERANTDPTLALGTLGFTTNVPNTSACTAGGISYSYVVDYRTGAPVSTSTTGVSAVKLGNALATRGVFVRLPNNTVVQLTRLSDGTTMTTNVPVGNAIGPARRISWRELTQDQ
ncbi:MAG TPA: PilC/PilY family type IV pilus protein [Rhodocyclaceae bacterium]|nr:PilC/PilY family type IV pilus protein [Rhodocyclaceae bacterium]